jgi:hypothetical protein
MREANPVDAAALRAELGAEEIARAMATAIGAATVPSDPIPAGDAFAAGLEPRPRQRPLRPAALVVGLAVVIAAVLLVAGAFSGGGAHPTYAAAAIEVAEANPRLLVTAPGWKVTDAGEFEADYGETTFGDGRRTLELHWYPAHFYRRYLRDRAQVSPPHRSRLLGRTATTVEYGHRGDYATMIAPIGGVFVEVRGRLGGHAAYEQVLHSLRPVDVDTWLAAMPARVVSPEARAHTVEAMLRGVPSPPGFDPSQLESETAVLNHYDLGVQVADAVACGWVESWLAARASGDEAAAQDPVEAMASSHHWPLLLRMARATKRSLPPSLRAGPAASGWSQNIWHAAAELRRGHLDQGFGQAMVRPDGSGYKIGPAWATELQCTARIRHVPFAAGEAPGAAKPGMPGI